MCGQPPPSRFSELFRLAPVPVVHAIAHLLPRLLRLELVLQCLDLTNDLLDLVDLFEPFATVLVDGGYYKSSPPITSLASPEEAIQASGKTAPQGATKTYLAETKAQTCTRNPTAAPYQDSSSSRYEHCTMDMRVWAQKQLSCRVLSSVWQFMVMVLQLCAFKFLKLAQLAGSTQDTTAEIHEQITKERQRKFEGKAKWEARPTRARWIQQCGWTATVAAIIYTCQYGYCDSGRSRQQEHGQQIAEGRWNGPGASWFESPFEKPWTRDIAGDRELPFPKSEQQCTNDQDGLATDGIRTEGHYPPAGGHCAAKGSLDTFPRPDRSRIRRAEGQIPRAYDRPAGCLEESRGGLQRGEEGTTDCRKEHRRKSGRRAHAIRCEYKQRQWNRSIPQTQDTAGVEAAGERRSFSEKAEARGSSCFRRGWGERDQAFWLGRYPSRQADGDARRPRFYNTVEEYYYDDNAAIVGDEVTRRLTYLNEGLQYETDQRLPLTSTMAPQYYADQAHYVALLMHHEVVAQDLPSGHLWQSSPFHEEYWDIHLEEMAAKRFDNAVETTPAQSFIDEAFEKEAILKSTGELALEAVEITPAPYYITDEPYYQSEAPAVGMNGRIAHAVATSTACTHIYGGSRDHSADFVDSNDYPPDETYMEQPLSCRLLDERQQETDMSTHVETQDRQRDEEVQDLVEPMLIIDEWEQLRVLLMDRRNEEGTELNLAMFGLFQDSIGTRYATAQPTIEAIRHSVMQAWHDYFRPGTTAYLHMVRPQRSPDGSEMQLLVEFSNRFFQLPVGDIPTVRRITWEGVWSEVEPVAAYHTQGISISQLLIQSGLREWCGPDLRTTCNLHTEGRITPPLSPIRIQAGSLLEVYIHFNAIEETDEDHTALFQTRARASSPNPHVLDLCCGADEYARVTSLQFWRRSQRETKPKAHAENDGTASSSAHPPSQPANRGNSQSDSGSYDESVSRTPNSDEDSSGSEYDPGRYDWTDELPHGLVKVACFKRGPDHQSDPILSIVSMRNEDDLHDHLATLYRMPARFIKGIIFVAPEPTFATEHGAWPIIVEQTQDRHDTTTQKLVVIQAEFYYSRANAADVATQWRVVILPHLASRNEVIAATDALNYCEALADGRCLVWHHGSLWPQQEHQHIISDGDLIRVAIPPIDEDMCESTWIRVQDTYDAGRLVGFPPENSDEEQRDPTPRSSVTGLRSSSISNESGWDSDMQDYLELSSPPRQAHGICCGSLGSPADFTQHPNADSVNPQSVHFDDRLRQLLDQIPGRQAVEVILYGLCHEDVGSFKGLLQQLSESSLQDLTNTNWPIFIHLSRSFLLVDPQPQEATATSLHIIVEFYEKENLPHPAHIPTLENLHLWLADGDHDVVRQAVYYDRTSTRAQLFRGLGEWCEDRSTYRCDAWYRDQPVQPGSAIELCRGDLITLRVAYCHPSWSRDIYRTFPNADVFYGIVLEITANQHIEPVLWHLFWHDGCSVHNIGWELQGSPADAISLCEYWYGDSGGVLHFVEHYYRSTGRLAFLFSPAELAGTPLLCQTRVRYGEDVTEELYYNCLHEPMTAEAYIEESELTLRASTPGASTQIHLDGNCWDENGLYPGALSLISIDIPHLQNLVEHLADNSQNINSGTAPDAAASLLQTTTKLLTTPRRLRISLAQHLHSTEDTSTSSIPIGISMATVTGILNGWKSVRSRINDLHHMESNLPEVTKIALESCGRCDDTDLPHCHIFTDGSFGKDTHEMTWSFAVILSDSADYLTGERTRFAGLHGGFATTEWLEPSWHGAEHACAYVAELEALFHAHWWVLCHDTSPYLHFHFDSLSAGFASSGQWGFQEGNRLCVATRALAQSYTQCHGMPATYRHVAAHNGDPWNELADFIAQSLRDRKLDPGERPTFEWHNLLVGSVCAPIENLPLSFLLLRGHKSYPSGSGHEMNLVLHHAPQKPAATDALWPLGQQTTAQDQGVRGSTQVRIKCCTLNVRTLYDQTASQPGGAAEYLRTQFSARGYHICALQETRAKESVTIEAADYIRLIAAGSNGREGCELWFSKDLPFFRQEKCTIQGLTVLHASATALVARLRIGAEFMVVASVHVPHSGKSAEERQEWWTSFNQTISRVAKHGRLLILGDFNAQLGEHVHTHVGDRVSPKTTPNGEALIQLLQDQELWIPSTFDHCQQGPDGTWKHPSADQDLRIDYVILDQRFGAFNVTTYVDKEIDTPGLGEDHSAAAAVFSFCTRTQRTTKKRAAIDEKAIGDPANAAEIKEVIANIEKGGWDDDIHTQYSSWAKQLHTQLAARYPQKRKQPRRHYITETTWMTRASKLAIKKDLVSAQKANQTELIDDLKEQLRQVSKRLQNQLAHDRALHLEGLLQEVDCAAPRDIFAKLRRLGIGGQMKRRRKRALPMMRDAAGNYAIDYHSSQEIWRQHAAALESGTMITGPALLKQCQDRQNARRGKVPPPGQCHLPTLAQVERACRRINPFKARGPDGVPGSLFHFFPAQTALSMYPMILKMLCYAEEPVGFKGGNLVHLYKGKGSPDLPENRRGILISNHASKVAHGAARRQFTAVLEHQMLPMQLGGRRNKSVQQSAHMLRMFLGACKRQKLSSGVIFLDIQTAYYKVIRELVAAAPTPIEILYDLVNTFKLPSIALQQLEEILQNGQSISAQSGMAPHMESLLSELHQDTWFTTPGIETITHTRVGTRPGSCFADVFFNFLFAHVLREVQTLLTDRGILTEIQWGGRRGLYMDAEDTSCTATIAETVWADDLALYLQHQDPEELIANLQEACAQLFNTCMKYGLTPNFSKGKTELLVALRGPGAVKSRRRWFTEAAGKLPIPQCNIDGCEVRMVGQYRHLGGQLDARATAKTEVKARTGQMLQAFRHHRKTVYTSRHIERSKRASLLRPLILSIADYNLGTLVNYNEKDQQYFATAVLRIYKSVYGKDEDEEEHHTSWARLCYALDLPSPEALQHLARLRYYGQVLRHGSDELWAMISTEQGWLQQCQQSFQWAFRQLGGSTHLPDPESGWEEWQQMILRSHKRWKGLLQRAWRHEIMQSYNQCIIDDGYAGFAEAIGSGGYVLPPTTTTEIQPETTHGCVQCQKTFQSRTAWASHAFKCHGRTNKARNYVTGSFCLGCQKEFWEYKRLLHRVQYSKACQRKLARAQLQVEAL